MKIFKRLAFLPFLILPTVFLSACEDELLINNVYVYLVKEDNKEFGYISGSQWQTVYLGSYTIEVTAKANEGYHFVSWSDGLESASRRDQATKDHNSGPVVYYALFEVDDE